MNNRILPVVLFLAVACFAESVTAAGETPAASVEFQPVRLGTTKAALEKRFGDALRPINIETPPSLLEQIAEINVGDTKDAGSADPVVNPVPAPFADQERLGRDVASADILSAEYDLFQDRVYRTRWRLDERFELPLMSALVAHLRERFGEPDYDQTIEAKVGSGKSDLRRSGWRRGNRAFEVRQLHPFNGGPFFVSLSDLDALERIIRAQGITLSQPDSTGAWWSRPQRVLSLASDKDRDELLRSVDALLERIEFKQE